MSMRLTDLVVGTPVQSRHDGDQFSIGMAALTSSLLEQERELRQLWRGSRGASFQRAAPTCCRLMLEQSMAALLGRVDPIRFVAIYKGARAPDFKIGDRNNSSLNWSRDVIPSGLVFKTGQHWTQDVLGKGIVRAMLDGHVADYVFSSSHPIALDLITDAVSSDDRLPQWLIQMQKYETGSTVLGETRKLAASAYSCLSKGIHFEFFNDGDTRPESEIIQQAVSDAISVIATVSLYVGITDISLNKHRLNRVVISFVDAIKHFSIDR